MGRMIPLAVSRFGSAGGAALRWLVRGALCLLCLMVPAVAAEKAPPSSITVVIDDTYPPYIFRTADGALNGILKDTWDLWSAKTGIRVDLRAMDWGKARQIMEAGQADVIDTLFKTPEREAIYDFSPPYATIDVPIFFHKSISGISDANTLQGFAIGVKSGDACIEWLEERAIRTLKRYPSYESIIDAAANAEIRVFCIDQPPASYFLYKKSLDGEFRQTAPLYSGQPHWAVAKGNTALFNIIAEGFAKISEAERHKIEARWMGTSILGGDRKYLDMITAALEVVGGAIVVLGIWTWMLRRQVTARTGELVTALEALKTSEARIRTIFDSVNDAIFIHDLSTGAILAVNRRMLEMYGYASEAEVISQPVSAFSEGTPPYDDDTAQKWMQKAAAGEPQVFEWWAKTKSGQLFWVEVGMRRALVDGATERLLVVARDISERKQADLALAERSQALERSNADLEQFAYVASHDLREPLRMVSSFVSLLERRYNGQLDGPGQEYIAYAKEGALRMDALVRDLLEFSRVGRVADPPVLLPLGEIVAQAIRSTRSAIDEAKAEIEVSCDLPALVCSGDELVRLFQNLISNAVKFRPSDRATLIRVGWEQRGPEQVFFVSDNGIGIDPAYFERIFKIFHRLHTRDKYDGTGIGLSICKKIVERHKGRIWVESEPGQGTTFFFTLKDLA
ncbi:putative two-component sensor histidine kinase, classical system [Candidatus Terasakiella magnetica]|nr:putative two-component sensor histidine kinase, classical system [Candidatus Terasakiella magnetica]